MEKFVEELISRSPIASRYKTTINVQPTKFINIHIVTLDFWECYRKDDRTITLAAWKGTVRLIDVWGNLSFEIAKTSLIGRIILLENSIEIELEVLFSNIFWSVRIEAFTRSKVQNNYWTILSMNSGAENVSNKTNIIIVQL